MHFLISRNTFLRKKIHSLCTDTFSGHDNLMVLYFQRKDLSTKFFEQPRPLAGVFEESLSKQVKMLVQPTQSASSPCLLLKAPQTPSPSPHTMPIVKIFSDCYPQADHKRFVPRWDLSRKQHVVLVEASPYRVIWLQGWASTLERPTRKPSGELPSTCWNLYIALVTPLVYFG